MEWGQLLKQLTTLRVYKAKHGHAPHKPLLLLVFIELAQQGKLTQMLRLTPELAYRFDCFWKVVAHRRTQMPDIRMPFHHLGGDRLLQPFDDLGRPSKDKSVTSYVVLADEFFEALADEEFRGIAQQILIGRWFEPAERQALYALLSIEVPEDDPEAIHAMFDVPEDAVNSGREGRFRIDIVTAYDFTCALTGYRVTTIAGGAIVDAAHIHQFSESKNNDPRNGLALCKNAHWAFDTGLWSLDDDFHVLIAEPHFAESAPQQTPLTQMAGQRIALPEDKRLWPDLKHVRWHRRHRFLGG